MLPALELLGLTVANEHQGCSNVVFLSCFDSSLFLQGLQQAKWPGASMDTFTSNKWTTLSWGQTVGALTKPLPVGGMKNVYQEGK